MTRRRIVLLGSAFLVATFGWWLWNPLRLSDAALQRWVEHRVPLRTDVARARDLIRASGWEVQGEWAQSEPSIDYGTRKGSRVVHVYLGHYRSVFRVDVDAFFGFDHSGRLVEVHIRRMVDAL
jgi:hypothetical protein